MQYLSKAVSAVNAELNLKVQKVMIMIFSIDLVYSSKHNTFILKCFYTIHLHQFGWLSERGDNFFNLLQKEGVPRKVKGFFQKRWGSNPG